MEASAIETGEETWQLGTNRRLMILQDLLSANASLCLRDSFSNIL